MLPQIAEFLFYMALFSIPIIIFKCCDYSYHPYHRFMINHVISKSIVLVDQVKKEQKTTLSVADKMKYLS